MKFVQVTGRPLFIVDRRMVVVKGRDCHTPCKNGGKSVQEGKRVREYEHLCSPKKQQDRQKYRLYYTVDKNMHIYNMNTHVTRHGSQRQSMHS